MKRVYKFLPIGLLVLVSSTIGRAQGSVSFTSSNLAGPNIINPTSLQFGPDGRLYVSRQNGVILALTVVRNGKNDYQVTATETISLVREIPNHNDDGTLNPAVNNRQITGLLVTGTPANPVLYVGSSDPRIGGGGSGGDMNLDTNSGIISKLTWNGSSWTKVDLVIGLPRSEENHSVNGMQLDEQNNILYVAVGGHTNAGAPSNNFAFLCEFALAAAILKIDLNMIQNQFGGSYALPTLDDPTRPNNGPGGADTNDPFGGNDGLNQAKLVIGGPVQIHSPGYRNAYDIVIMKTEGKEGRMYTIDNGANAGWGGHPDQEGASGNPLTTSVTNNYVVGEPGSTGPGPNDAVVNNKDGLHLVSMPGMSPIYAGHPNPIRANPAGAGWYRFDNATNTAHFELSPTADWPPVPLAMANPVEGDYRNPGVNDGSLYTWNSSTNGIAEYTSDKFFSGNMAGDLLTASFDGNIYRIKLTEDGTATQFVESIASGFGSIPLDVIAQGNGEQFEGTIWVANYGSNTITVFEPEGSWEPVTTADNSVPVARHENGFVELNGRFYLLGGRETTIMNIYDPELNIWTTGANLPFIMHHFQPIVWDDKIYVLGAYKGTFSNGNVNNSESPVDKIYIYDPVTDAWSEGATIPRPRGSAGVVVYNNEFYMISGIVNGHQDGWVLWVDKYNPATNTWQQLADAPRERDHFQAVVHQGKIYLTGGRKTNAAGNVFGVTIAEVDVYDIATNTWQTLPPSANVLTQRAGTSSVLLNDEIYLIGGESTTQTISHKQTQIFNPLTQVWRQGPSLITGRHGTGSLVYNNSIFTVAGSANRGGGPVINSMEVLLSASTCSGDVDNFSLDDDGDCYSNGDETLNGTNPCSASSKPADFDGDCISDLHDPDDDNDGIPDTQDAFAWDADNGMTTTIPLFYPLLNGDPGFGFYGLGFTGLMTNQTTDYLDLFDADNPNLIMGGAVGIATVPANSGDATTNNQEYAFQFGFKINPADGVFSIRAKLQGTPFFNGIPLNELDDQTQGIYIGTGNQDNYLKIVLAANSGNPGVKIFGENGGTVFIDQTQPVNNILTTGIVYFNIDVNPVAGTVQLYYQTGSDNNKIPVGSPIVLPSSFAQILAGNTAMAVGIIASSGSGEPFSASWDFINISTSGPYVNENAPPYFNRYVGNPTQPFVLDLNTVFNDNEGVNNLTYEVVSVEEVSFIDNHTLVNDVLTINFLGSLTGSARVVLRATDQDDLSIDYSFLIQVIPQPTPIIRINSGGNRYGSWAADTYFSGGNLFSQITPIANTNDDPLYQTERWGTTFTYQIPVPQNGFYRLNLHFAEIFHGISNGQGVGARVFNVAAEGNPVLTNYDIFQKTGGSAIAIIEAIDSVLVNDGVLNLTFTTIADRAKISAIEVAEYILSPIPNAPPIVDPIPDRHIYSGQPFSQQVVASDFNFGDALQYTANGLPGSLTIDNATGLISGVVDAANGDYVITVTVSDGNGGITESEFTIHVVYSGDYSLRINSGGPGIAYGNEVWSGDQFYLPSSTFVDTVAIANSSRDEIYYAERFASHLVYEIPMPGPGVYRVTLHFAEIYFSSPGSRVFNMSVEGQGSLEGYDIVQEAGGPNLAVTEDFEVTVTDGFLTIDGTSSINQPKLSGIELSACAEPVIASVEANPNPLCDGPGQTTLTVNGVLGEAAAWHLYTGACGGTLVESNTTGVFVVNPDVTTTYYVRGEGGCIYTETCTEVTVPVVTVNTAVTRSGNTLRASATGATYQWINCTTSTDIPGATDQTFSPEESGIYSVRINQDGCIDTSNCIDFIVVGLEEDLSERVTVYPNPGRSIAVIELPVMVSNLAVDITDIQGRVTLRELRTEVNRAEIDVSGLRKGMYIMHIQTEKFIKTLKYIVN